MGFMGTWPEFTRRVNSSCALAPLWLILLCRENQRRPRQCLRNVAVRRDRCESGFPQPVGILRQRPAFAFRRVRERVDGESQSEGRLRAFFIGHEVVDDEDAAGYRWAFHVRVVLTSNARCCTYENLDTPRSRAQLAGVIHEILSTGIGQTVQETSFQ